MLSVENWLWYKGQRLAAIHDLLLAYYQTVSVAFVRKGRWVSYHLPPKKNIMIVRINMVNSDNDSDS